MILPRIIHPLGKVIYLALLPLFFVYGHLQKQPRTRAIILHKEKVLLVKNFLSLQTWSLPGGGVNKNESTASAIIREIEEEVGFTVTENPTSLGIIRSLEPTTSFTVEVFAIHLPTRPTVVIDGKEIIDYQWVDIDLLKDDEILYSLLHKARAIK